MSTTNTTESSTPLLDWVKWLVVVALLAGGIWGNWYYRDQSLLARVFAMVGIAAVALTIAAFTERGRSIWALLKESRVEIRRVVWPTWPETRQTTFIVVLLVLAFSLILWGLDSALGFVVSRLIG